MVDVPAPEPHRDEHFDRLAFELLAAVAEEALGLAVDQDHAPAGIGDHGGVGRRVEQDDEQVAGVVQRRERREWGPLRRDEGEGGATVPGVTAHAASVDAWRRSQRCRGD
ncbi:MAG TPA: hypothetical protein VM242_05405 [Acidimicrobiales bacterium]|nr:hypothetical protein [Acidimicrobiales bacterium]